MKKKNLIFTIVLLLLLFILTSSVPLLGYDDYKLNTFRIQDTGLFNAMLKEMSDWNGRSTQMIGYIIGSMPRIVFFILNTMMIGLFIYLVYFYSYKDKKEKYIPTVMITLFFLFYLFQATFDDFFWMAGSCNHLYSTIMNLVVLIPFKELLKNNIILKKKYIIFYYILVLLAATSIENIGVFMLPVMLGIFLYYQKKNKKSKIKWPIISIVLYLIGYIYILLLPSTGKRSKKITAELVFEHTKGIKKLLEVFKLFVIKNALMLIILLIVLIGIICLIHLKKKKLQKEEKINLIFLLGSLTTVFIFYFVPYYSDRAMLFTNFFMLVNVNYYLLKVLEKKKIIYIISILFFLLSNIYGYYYHYMIFTKSSKIIKIRNKEIIKQVNQKKKVIIYTYIPCNYGNRVLEYKEGDYDEDAFKRYYHIDKDVQFLYHDPSIEEGYNRYCVHYKIVFNIIDDLRYKKEKGMWITINNREDIQVKKKK